MSSFQCLFVFCVHLHRSYIVCIVKLNWNTFHSRANVRASVCINPAWDTGILVSSPGVSTPALACKLSCIGTQSKRRDVQDCLQIKAYSSAFVLLIFLCSLIQTLTPTPNNALLAILECIAKRVFKGWLTTCISLTSCTQTGHSWK